MRQASKNQFRGRITCAFAVAAALAAASCPASAAENGKFRIGVVSFLSGAAAGPFGVPAANAAKLTVDALNSGKLPSPYSAKGINGVEIELVLIDEAGGPTKQAEEYRNLVQRQKVDAVVGYTSSGDCLALAPIAEELKTPTIFFDCGTSNVFQVVKAPKYVFRTGLDQVVDNIAAARYIAETRPNVKSVAGIQQNYAWGQESWATFVLAFKQIKPEIKVVSEQWPKLAQGQYGAEISALSVAKPDLIHSSLWGGDMEGFMLQGGSRGLFENRNVILTAGETGMHNFKGQAPEGTILGGRGPFGPFAPKNALNQWFAAAYKAKFNESPVFPSYKMIQAILGLKAAAERGGKSGIPTADQIVAGFTGLTFEAPSGTVRMARASGHQAVQDVPYGEYHFDAKAGVASVTNIKTYAGECVMPPDGTLDADWIKAGFPGAKCN
ncbi:ABC transporter substrate-binding protein [Sphaerotilaceae bacterium SBD11-9]